MEATKQVEAETNGHHIKTDNRDGFYDGEDGVYAGIPEADYHALDRCSNSVLGKLIENSPAHARAKMDDEYDPSRSQKFGSALHSAVLTPDVFEQTYATKKRCVGVTGSGSRCKNSGKRAFLSVPYDEEMEKKHGGPEEAAQNAEEAEIRWYCDTHVPPEIETVTESFGGDLAIVPVDLEVLDKEGRYSMDKIKTIRQRLLENDAASILLQERPGLEEITILWTHEPTGVRCKSRIDRIAYDPTLGYFAVDLKTARSAKPGTAPGDFGYSAAKYGYYRQAAFYIEALSQAGIPTDKFYILAAEKSPPYSCVAYQMVHADLEQGRKEILDGLRSFRQCLDDREWPHYTRALIELQLPTWINDR